MRPALPFTIMLLAVSVTIAGCAARGPFPSLAPRAVERELAEADVAEPAPVIIADDPALAARVEGLIAEAKAGQTAFEDAFGTTAKAVQSAAPSGSEAWVEAQQALSRLEAANARTGRALADLDALALGRAKEGQPTSMADLARIEAAMAEIQALADAQRERSESLRARLSRP